MQNMEIGVSAMPPPTWVDWWQPCGLPPHAWVLGDPYIRGAAARFAPFHLQQLGLERESRERKCRFEVSKLFDLVILVYFSS